MQIYTKGKRVFIGWVAMKLTDEIVFCGLKDTVD